MSRKMALLISTALTVFVLVIVSALVMRVSVGGLEAQAASAAPQNADPAAGLAVPAPQTDPSLDALAQHDQTALSRLNDANAQIQKENDELRALQDEIKKLQALNAAMAQREKVYQQRLAAANNTIAQMAAPPAAAPAGGGGDGNGGPAVNAPNNNSGGGSPNQGAPTGNSNPTPKPSGGNNGGHDDGGHDDGGNDGGGHD